MRGRARPRTPVTETSRTALGIIAAVLSPVLLWSPGELRLRELLLRLAATAVVLASLASGLTALVRDLRFAYRNAGPSVFTDVDRRQMSAVREAVHAGDTILLVGTPDDVWHAGLWQRGMYPRNTVVLVLGPYDAAAIGELRHRYDIAYAVLLGPPPFDPGFRWSRDLGSLPGLPHRVSFGELSP
jgi:hypothetical protein